jgi:uncharacterized protein (DUF1810 family)
MPGMTDAYHLERFVAAQSAMLDRVAEELGAGTKRTHWMWYVFPQIAGLGRSAMARNYAISGRAEAVAYLAHPVLGKRLLEATDLVLGHAGARTAEQIFGPVDAAKFRACMTLFGAVSGETRFGEALAAFFGGVADPATLSRLS